MGKEIPERMSSEETQSEAEPQGIHICKARGGRGILVTDKAVKAVGEAQSYEE